MKYTFAQFLSALDADDFNNALSEPRYPDRLRRTNNYLQLIPHLGEEDAEEVENLVLLLRAYESYLENPDGFRTVPWDTINKKNVGEVFEK